MDENFIETLKNYDIQLEIIKKKVRYSSNISRTINFCEQDSESRNISSRNETNSNSYTSSKKNFALKTKLKFRDSSSLISEERKEIARASDYFKN